MRWTTATITLVLCAVNPLQQWYWFSVLWIHSNNDTVPLCGESTATITLVLCVRWTTATITLVLCAVNPLQQWYWFSARWSHCNNNTGPLCRETTATMTLVLRVVNPLQPKHWSSGWWNYCNNNTGPLCGETTATITRVFVVKPLQH